MALKIKPSEIRYSQNSIKSHFVNGSALGFNLDEICEGRLDASIFPIIRVAKRNEKWFTMDNRRLWLFRQLERLGKCGEIPVQAILTIPDKKMTTKNDGNSVNIRGSPGGSWVSKPDVPVSERRPATFFKIEPSRLQGSAMGHNRPSPYRAGVFDFFDDDDDFFNEYDDDF